MIFVLFVTEITIEQKFLHQTWMSNLFLTCDGLNVKKTQKATSSLRIRRTDLMLRLTKCCFNAQIKSLRLDRTKQVQMIK